MKNQQQAHRGNYQDPTDREAKTLESDRRPVSAVGPGQAGGTQATEDNSIGVEMSIGEQLAFLFILALPVASIAWTVTHEEVFREPREWCQQRSESCNRLLKRKFFYLFTCEYCFSHYVSVILLFLTHFKLLYIDWRGYLISWFALVWVANVYMNLYSHVRLDIKRERVQIAVHEKTIAEVEAAQGQSKDGALPVPQGTSAREQGSAVAK